MIKDILSQKWVKPVSIVLFVLVTVFTVIIAVLYNKQDALVKELVTHVNKDFKGRLELQDSHISPFKNFPYISVDLENVKIYEGKSDTSELLLHINDTYVGFELTSLFSGSFEIKKITLQSGFIKLVQHTDGSFNIANALSGIELNNDNDNEDESPVHLDLKSIRMTDIDLLKYNEENKVLVEAYVYSANSRFSSSNEKIETYFDSEFYFNLIIDQDTTFIHDKNVELTTEISFDSESQILTILPSELLIDKVLFSMEGAIDIGNDMDLDLEFKGNKPNFDLFLAFAPPEIEPVLSRYDNKGLIYFDAVIKGKSINGHNPKIDVDFGCKEAFIHNTVSDKMVNDLYFEGHFSNGDLRNPSTMELIVKDFSARPETGNFKGNLTVKNFDSPDINLQLFSEFDLEFLVEFLNLDNLEDVNGSVSLEMNFHDIIDLSEPEKSIERFNESYFTRLNVSDLSFRSSAFPWAVKDLNIQGVMDGHEAEISRLDFKVGKSDVAMKASISDLPAILHHSNIPVRADLDIRSSTIDLRELSGYDKDTLNGINEEIHDLSMHFSFLSSAKAFTESPNLPVGEFFIDNLNAGFTHYPHSLHDFHADILIDSSNFEVIDFSGMVDKSDFHFNGNLKNYDLWFDKTPIGNTTIDFDLTSNLLKLEDMFTFGGENYVPEDYRHEEFRNLAFHGLAELFFNRKLVKTNLSIDHLSSKMNVHSMRFEDFKGQFSVDSTHVEIHNFGGKLGNSTIDADLLYYFNPAPVSGINSLTIKSDRLDFDQLFDYNPPPTNKKMTPEDHENVFNVFDLPFSDMEFAFDIKHLNYHRYLLDDFILNGRVQKNHYVYLDTMSLHAAGGGIGLSGYFNGSNPDSIYFSPSIYFDHVDIDRLMFKFENFGQDYLVSENLHGALTGHLKGKIHMHADMVPIIDDSNMEMDLMILKGSINNYAPFEAMSGYFADKNLNMVRFDTLQNQLYIENGVLKIPNMNINSSLGFFEISGEQNMDFEMQYFVRLPLNLVSNVGIKKLFGNSPQDTVNQEDEITYRNKNEKVRFLNIKIEGELDDYKISLGKNKK